MDDCHLTMQEMYDKYHVRNEGISWQHHAENAGEHPRGKPELEAKINTLKEVLIDYKKQNPEVESKWSAAFKFSVVRNPWDRFASIYHWHKKDFGGFENFEDFLSALREGKTPFDKGVLSYTQSDYLKVNEKIELNHLCKYESLGSGVEKLYAFLAEKKAPPFKIMRRVSENSRFGHMKLYTDFEQIYTVFRHYYEDVRNFGYTYDPSDVECEVTRKCFKRYQRENHV